MTPCRRASLLISILALAGCATSIAPSSTSSTSSSAASALVSAPAVDQAEAIGRFEREWKRVEGGPSELRITLTARPLAFFRFVNQVWTDEVCSAFADEIARVPTARLHGDAHIEQYAVTTQARGLDDFDDSSRGPALVDVTRFMGSIELATAQRGWQSSLDEIGTAFMTGYRRALEDPTYMPPDPRVVTRARAEPVKSGLEFLAWADTLMEPLSAGEATQLERAWPSVVRFAARTNPEATPAFLERKAVGWLHMGIGSALTPKLLIRIQGPTAADEDDLILEAKQVGPFESGACVSIPQESEASRVVEGIMQIGRLPQLILVALPGLVGTESTTRGWWVKSWDRTFLEVSVDTYQSPDELREVAHDVGVQLGSSNLIDPARQIPEDQRRSELNAITRLEPRIREVAHELATALTEAWRRGRGSR